METLENKTATNSLTWSITRNEKRGHTQKFLIRIVIPMIVLGFFSATIAYPGLSIYKLFSGEIDSILYNALYVTIGIIVCLILFFIGNKIFPYAERSYVIDSSGVNIIKGKKQRKYVWNEFEYFYPYSGRSRATSLVDNNSGGKHDYVGQSFRDTMYNAEKNLGGDIFYLKKKNIFSLVYKKFVVVYGEVENSSDVSKSLSRYLPQRKMKATSDLGLVFYEFK